jgi:hypothetical protein
VIVKLKRIAPTLANVSSIRRTSACAAVVSLSPMNAAAGSVAGFSRPNGKTTGKIRRRHRNYSRNYLISLDIRANNGHIERESRRRATGTRFAATGKIGTSSSLRNMACGRSGKARPAARNDRQPGLSGGSKICAGRRPTPTFPNQPARQKNRRNNGPNYRKREISGKSRGPPCRKAKVAAGNLIRLTLSRAADYATVTIYYLNNTDLSIPPG